MNILDLTPSISAANAKENKYPMHKRMKLSEQIEGYYSQLKTLRKQYARSQNKNSLTSEILRLERAILKDANEVKRMDNEIRAIEIPMLKK